VSTVIGARFSDAEREQVESAAARLGLNLSGFVRQAALAASARIEKKVAVEGKPPPEPERSPFMLLDPEPVRHMVDGEYVSR
jgi:hypothetical protein